MDEPTNATGTPVRFSTQMAACEAVLFDHPIARDLLARLPCSSTVDRWGDEVYFTVPLQVPNSHPTQLVRVGDIAYWPEGPCVCIFFGPTPVSQGREPRPASSVTVIGHTDASPDLLRLMERGAAIVMERTGAAPSAS